MDNINLINRFDQLVVSSREVADNFGKRPDNVLRDLDELISDSSYLSSEIIESEYTNSRGRKYREYLLTEKGLTIYLFNIQGFNEYKLAYINEFDRMKQYIEDLKFNVGDKKHQLHCMAMLGDLLPEELKKDKVSYVKANTVVNKCISNMYGFEKMVKKGDMSKPMLEDREHCLDDYIKLYDILQDNTLVSDALHKKYDKKLLK